MQEAGPLAGHRIFVAAGKIEYPVGNVRQIGLDRHEAMIAVDHYTGTLRTGQRCQRVQVRQDSPGIEQDLAGKDQVKCAVPSSSEEFLWRHCFQQYLARLHPACHLAAKAVEFAVGCQHLDRLHRHGGDQPHQKIMRVRRKAEGRGIRQVELIRDMLLRLRPDRSHDPVPFVVGQNSCIVPSCHMSVTACIGPEMMAVGSEMQPLRIGRQRAGKQMFPAHSWVRSDQSSGKARLPTVL